MKTTPSQFALRAGVVCVPASLQSADVNLKRYETTGRIGEKLLVGAMWGGPYLGV